MTFNDFLNLAWDDHANKPQEVASRFREGMKLIESNDQIPGMAHLMTHVMGEHLGEWEKGISILLELKGHPHFEANTESEAAIKRSIGVLTFASGKNLSLESFTLSDKIRILSVAASALNEQKKTREAQEAFRNALGFAQAGLSQTDPANRSLAITGNNLACTLEEKEERTQAEIDLMILAAETGRKYWEIAGDWMNVERAEYRLSQTYLKAKNLARSLEHAQTCLEIINENKGDALESFFGWEAVALVEKARENHIGFEKALDQMKNYFDRLEDSNKSWCKKSLEKVMK